MFEIAIWVGAALSVIGLVGIIWSILRVMRARRAGLDDESLKSEIQAVMPWNLGAFFVSAIGLMLVVMGVILA